MSTKRQGTSEDDKGSEDLQLRLRKIDNGLMVLSKNVQRYSPDLEDAKKTIDAMVKRWAQKMSVHS